MILVTGGAFQGKREFVSRYFSITKDTMLDGSSCPLTEITGAECLYNYHDTVRRLMEKGDDPCEFTRRLCKENPYAVIIMNEIGCGIIPMEKKERIWREQVGRCGCIIAENSSLVVRVICGRAVCLKGKL